MVLNECDHWSDSIIIKLAYNQGVQGVLGPRAKGWYQGGGFWDPKIDQFWSKFKNKPNLGLNYTKLALIELN